MARPTRHVVRGKALAALPYGTRIEIVEALMVLRKATVEELGRFLVREPNSLYHHLRPLMEVGLVVEHGKRATSKRPAAVLRLPALRLELDPEDRSPAAQATRRRLAKAVMRTALARQLRGLDDPELALGGRRPSLLQSLRIARLGPRGHARVVRALRELNELLLEEHDPDGRAFALTVQLAPYDP